MSTVLSKAEQVAQLRFMSGLQIVDERGIDTYFSSPFPDQVLALQDFMSEAETVVHYKPRQVGDTTVASAYNFTYSHFALDPVKTLVVTHHDDSTKSIFKMLRHFNDSLPGTLRRRTMADSTKELTFADTRAGFRCTTAGGRSHGRSWTYQRLHADEVAYWPNAKDVWASVTSTMHPGPHRKVIVMSTAAGPGGLFHEKVLAAQDAVRRGDSSVRFRFFSWAAHPAYSKEPPGDWEPEQDEYELGLLHGLSWGQLYWRHNKIHGVDGVGLARFRREYPLTIEDGFLVFEGTWFDVDYLNEVYSSLREVEGELRIYEDPRPGMTYAMGVDPSWCNGGDAATAQVLSHDGRQVATLSMREGGEILFAQKAIDLAAHFNKARSLIESNPGGAGKVVLRAFLAAGIPLWTQPPEPGHRTANVAKYWTTHHGSKEEGYAHLRQMVDGDVLTLKDRETVQELMHVRETSGKIEGHDGYRDDLADSLMLAEWNRRTLPGAKGWAPRPRRHYRAARSPFISMKDVVA